MIDFALANYRNRAKTILPWTHWKLTDPAKPRQAPLLLLIVDIYIPGDPKKDVIKTMELRKYEPDEPRKFSTLRLPAFFELIDKKQVVEFVPKA